MDNKLITENLRPDTAKLVSRLLYPLCGVGTITIAEYSIIARNLQSLAKTGELQPAIMPKLITPQEAAEMLAISYSQFRTLEKEGVFPFKRRMVGNKTVRYLNTDIIHYATVGSIEKGGKNEIET